MVKVKAASVPNKVLLSRVSYLYQAASYLATQQQKPTPEDTKPINSTSDGELFKDGTSISCAPAARRLISDLKAVSQKAQIRLSPAMKLSMCKMCNTMLIEGSTCSSETENKSKGGKRSWADVLVRKCAVCGYAKRYPLGNRQKRRSHRIPEVPVPGEKVEKA